MNGLTKLAIGMVLLGTTLSFLNDNYEGLKAGLLSGLAADEARRTGERETVLADRFLGLTQREHHFLDTPREDGRQAPGDGVYRAALTTWDGFAARAFGDDPAWTDAMVRVVLEGNGGQAWVGDLRRGGDGTISGTVIQSDGRSRLKPGETLRFDRFAVWDWSIRSGGKVFGHYSLRLNVDSLPPALRDGVADGLSDADVPPDWAQPAT